MRLLALLVMAGTLTGCWGLRPSVSDKPILKINSTNISTQEFADRLARQMRNYDALQVKDAGNLQHAKDQTVQMFVIEVLTKDYAKKAGLVISDADIEAESKNLRKSYPDDLTFRRALADENVSYDQWKKDIAFTLLQKKVYAQVTKDAPEPTEAEMKEYYDANKLRFQRSARLQLRQIVVEKEDTARRLLQDLASGGDMGKLAKQYSIAPEADNGGVTDWIEKGTLDIFDQGFKMPLRQRSKVLQSPYGYHIFEVIKKEPESHLSFADAKANIKTLLKERKDQGAFSAWLEQQVRQSSVLRNDELIGAIKVSTKGN